MLKLEDGNKSFWQKMVEKYNNNILVNKSGRNISKTPASKPVNFSDISFPPIPLRLTKKQLSKFKFHGKNRNKT